MHLGYAWRLAVRQYPVILLLALAGLVAAFSYSSFTKVYSTTTYLTVQPTTAQATSRAADPLRFFHTQTQTILGDQLLGAAVTGLGDDTTVDQLRRSVDVSDGSTADVVGVTVSGSSAQSARARQLAVLGAIDGQSFADVTLARLWTSPMSSPSGTRALAAGFTAGAAAGVLLVLIWGAARRPVHHPRYLQLERAVRTYPVVVDLHSPDQVQRLQSWLGRPAGEVDAVGRSDGQASRLAAHLGTDEGLGGPKLLVAAVGGATEHAIEEAVSLSSETAPPVLVVVSSSRRKRGQR